MDVQREKYRELVHLFSEHAHQLHTLQQHALQDIIPDVQLEYEVSVEDSEWLVGYLQDLGSLFRIFRRQKLIVSFTREALRGAILWRLSVLKTMILNSNNVDGSVSATTSVPGLHAVRSLPFNCLDRVGRPISILRVAELDLHGEPVKLRRNIVLTLERLRIGLQRLNERKSIPGPPVLQNVLILDMDGVSMKSIPLDIVRWYTHEVQPWYSGSIGLVLVLNYNWAHSGLWNILKRILPASTLAKVAFPSQANLVEFLSEDSLETISSTMQDMRRCQQFAVSHQDIAISSNDIYSARSHDHTSHTTLNDNSTRESERRSRKMHSSRFSFDNPFFGYPTDILSFLPSWNPTATPAAECTHVNGYSRVPSLASPASHPNLSTRRYGRRRKRDLAWALLVLYWRRWHAHIEFGVLIIFLVGLMKSRKVTWLRFSALVTPAWITESLSMLISRL